MTPDRVTWFVDDRVESTSHETSHASAEHNDVVTIGFIPPVHELAVIGTSQLKVRVVAVNERLMLVAHDKDEWPTARGRLTVTKSRN